ncbi:retrovirus-related pol polyprotein from transposon TNT 1-94 [Tanacetum coccineum]|uniref:Retrovirus-related pol polyprotein from transposon TNT 1-94 n=1 Tax=Tanacetum coccineum TaxID=301880 RepID=A0ABQ5A4F9_9ASTR
MKERENRMSLPSELERRVRDKSSLVSQPHVVTKKDVNSDSNGLSSTGVDNTAKTRRPQPRSNTKNDRVPSASKSSCNKNKEVEVEEHPRNLLLSKNKKHIVICMYQRYKLLFGNDKSEVVCAMCKQCLITANHDGYFVEGSPLQLGHNLVLVGLFYDSDLEVAFRRNIVLSKDEAPEVIKTFLSDLLVLIQSPTVYHLKNRDNGTEFQKSNLKEYFDSVGISHQTSSVRTPQQNGVVERRNQENVRDDIGALYKKLCMLIFIGGQPSSAPRTAPAAQAPQVLQTPTATTTTADTTPTPTNSSSQATNFSNTSQDVDELETLTTLLQHHRNYSSEQFYDIGINCDPMVTCACYAFNDSIWNQRNVKRLMTVLQRIESMQEELLQFKRLDVWVLVPLPDNIKPLTLKWLLKNKHDEENTVIRNKTRLVVRGYRQEEGIDFEESSLLLLEWKAIRIFLALCAHKIVHYVSNDMKTAFFHVKKQLYGLKQAQAWYDELSMFLLQESLFKGTIDPTLFIRRFDDDILGYRYRLNQPRSSKRLKGSFRYLRATVNTGLWYTKDSAGPSGNKKTVHALGLSAEAEYVSYPFAVPKFFGYADKS